jgi:DNA-binding CsgD family transcriptional regulator
LSALDPQLIDRIYECAFAPERWPEVLLQCAKIAHARIGWLMVVEPDRDRCTASNAAALEGLLPLMESRVASRSERLKRACDLPHAGFVREIDFYPNEEFRSDSFYRDHIYPRGLGWCAGATFVLPTRERLLICLERDYERGPVESEVLQQLDVLRPHLARSAVMAARLGIEQARIAGETLALIGLPAVVLDERGKVLAANRLAEALTEHIRWRAVDRVSLKDPAADSLFRQAIETLHVSDAAPTRSFALRGADGAAAMVAHVIPTRAIARDIFLRSAGVLVLTPVTLPQAPPVELVRSLFDLTPAEARVARSLAAGGTVEEIASSGGVSRNTIRTQVRGVLEKTGCRRQAEGVALLSGIAVPQGSAKTA